jgi:septal ring factor EnvC (AmiA/AmiB activator)
VTLLLWLTLGYAVILVLALAIGLTAIWWRLRGIDRALAAARDSLTRVRDATAPLETAIEPMRERMLESARSLQTAARELSAADEGLERRLERVPAGRSE